jgi:hypothetical protein
VHHVTARWLLVACGRCLCPLGGYVTRPPNRGSLILLSNKQEQEQEENENETKTKNEKEKHKTIKHGNSNPNSDNDNAQV